jgi:hypothetical protein
LSLHVRDAPLNDLVSFALRLVIGNPTAKLLERLVLMNERFAVEAALADTHDFSLFAIFRELFASSRHLPPESLVKKSRWWRRREAQSIPLCRSNSNLMTTNRQKWEGLRSEISLFQEISLYAAVPYVLRRIW